MRLAIQHTGPSIVTAGVTNAAAFFAMGLSGFRGVTELGVIAGGGMLIATAGTMTVLPALLLLVHRKGEAAQIPAQAVATRVEQLLLRRPYFMLTVFGIITVGALVVGWTARFDYNVLNLQSKGLPSVETELRLLNADVESTLFAAIVCDDLQQTRADARASGQTSERGDRPQHRGVDPRTAGPEGGDHSQHPAGTRLGAIRNSASRTRLTPNWFDGRWRRCDCARTSFCGRRRNTAIRQARRR